MKVKLQKTHLFLRMSMVIYETYAVHMTVSFLKSNVRHKQHIKLELEVVCGRYKAVTGSALAGILKSRGHYLE